LTASTGVRGRVLALRGRVLGGRDLLLLADTALLSASSVLLLVIAARALPASGLTAFALAQPLIATAVGAQRATFLAPGLVVQRTVGRSWIPITWIPRISLPIALVVSAVGAATLGFGEGRPTLVAGVVVLAALAALAQDVLRYRLLSRGRIRGALRSDLVLAVLTAATALLIPVVKDWAVLLALWALWTLIAIVVAALALRKRDGSEALPDVRLRDTWRLGRWSGLDSVLGTVSYLLPLYISSLVLGSVYAGVYRLLQAANGPLNILDTAIVTSFGLDAWSIKDADDVRRLRSRVRRLVGVMALVAAGYLVFAEIAIILLSGVRSTDLVRIAIIVLAAGMLGAITTPLSAASLALGFQKGGAIIRAVVVTVSIGISLAAAAGLPLPWNDPIGAVAIFAPAATVIGWFVFYRSTTRRAIVEAEGQVVRA
jgi:O-antigen/teichoic acid export membrane protein